MTEPSALTFVGMDVHRDTIAIALLRPGEHIPLEESIANTPEAVRKQLRRWGDPASLRICDEAGPTGYELQLPRVRAFPFALAPPSGLDGPRHISCSVRPLPGPDKGPAPDRAARSR